jgi:hypothetical protein
MLFPHSRIGQKGLTGGEKIPVGLAHPFLFYIFIGLLTWASGDYLPLDKKWTT